MGLLPEDGGRGCEIAQGHLSGTHCWQEQAFSAYLAGDRLSGVHLQKFTDFQTSKSHVCVCVFLPRSLSPNKGCKNLQIAMWHTMVKDDLLDTGKCRWSDTERHNGSKSDAIDRRAASGGRGRPWPINFKSSERRSCGGGGDRASCRSSTCQLLQMVRSYSAYFKPNLP